VRLLAYVAAALITGYAIAAWRRRRITRPQPPDDTAARRTTLAGLASGLLLTLPNPGALTAWIAVAAALWPDATIAEAALLAAGVGLGSAVWFASLARWVSRARPDHAALRILPRAALILLVAIAALGVARAH
jgi:arginine exporter protein ArgO